ncbi:MAG: DUF86 domain-containing protein [Oscillospiraceae bacterium]|jgi:uncharacterized protein with HEPN domain|nr:DUF86 domain-containing protein [Oscillospiraceae bacterium]
MLDRNRAYLEDMTEEVDFIIKVTNKIPKELFLTDNLLQHGIMMALVNIGESANKLSPDFKEKYTDVEWKEIVGLRNITAHAYKAIEFDRIWENIVDDIPKLANTLKSVNI